MNVWFFLAAMLTTLVTIAAMVCEGHLGPWTVWAALAAGAAWIVAGVVAIFL